MIDYKCKHQWDETGAIKAHATVPVAIYVRCKLCKQNGFKIPHNDKLSPVVYTWSEDDPPCL